MNTALGVAIFAIGCVSVAAGIYGARLLYKLEKSRMKTVRKSAPPFMPCVYQGNLLETLRRTERPVMTDAEAIARKPVCVN